MPLFLSFGEELGQEFVERVLDNLVSEESNVRQVVTRVALGEADAGIVYQTDVIGAVSERVITIRIDQEHNQLASYPIAILDRSPRQALAQTFVDFVLSERGQSVLSDLASARPPRVQPSRMPAPCPRQMSSLIQLPTRKPTFVKTQRRQVDKLLLYSVSGFAFLLLTIPILVLFLSGIGSRAWEGVPESSTVLSAVLLSFASTLIVVCLAAAFGTPLAFVLARNEFRGRRFVSLFIELPIVMPPAVAGLALSADLWTPRRDWRIPGRPGYYHTLLFSRGRAGAILHLSAVLHPLGPGRLCRHLAGS